MSSSGGLATIPDHLTSLPELVLLKIESFLKEEDSQSLGLACKRLQSVCPRYLVMRGKDFKIKGPAWGHFTPEHYFDGPRLTGSVKKLSISLKWKDQGWGNRKGDIFLTLVRDKEVVAEKYNPLGLAPHKEEEAKTELINDPIVTEVREGDYYKFSKNPGGGGGHQLTVKNYRVVVHYY